MGDAMAISDHITQTVIVPPQTDEDGEEHRSGWWAGYTGKPKDAGASVLWLNAYAQGSKRRAH